MSTGNDERHERLYAIFRAACDLAGDERSRYLDEACGDDDALRSEIERLLAVDAGDAQFLATPALGTPVTDAMRGEAAVPPARIGRYRVIRKLDEGGMGVVYLAEQDNPRRTVALKLLRHGATDAEHIARFAHEAQLLGRLQHPGVAQIHEAGTADTGHGPQPYFAMEYVQGLPLLEYARANGLSARARLAALASVCDAVHHAHQKGIIHRDLKPANVLVPESGEPKVLDFGVARATDADIRTTTLRTTAGQLLGTIPYMSPEQASGDPDDIDVRSDVYALGVIGYELLAGRLPYDLGEKPIHEAVRIIREREPAPLSARAPALRGDVETIVAKALEKERRRRYQSAAELAEDIRRSLRDEPILARPASAIYQLRKFARRHPALVAGSAVVVLALLVGVIGTSRQWRRAEVALADREVARQLAAEEAERARVVNDFLVTMLSSASPRGRGRDLKVVEVLDDASGRIDTDFAEQPLLAGQLHQTLGVLYRHLGAPEKSEAHHRAALELRERVLAADDVPLLETLHHLSIVLFELGRLDEAERLVARTLESQRRVHGVEHAETLFTMNNLGLIWWQRGKLEEAEAMFVETLEINRRLHGEEDRATRAALGNLALVLHQQGRLAEAEPFYRTNLEMSERLLGPEHPTTLIVMNNLAMLLLMDDRPAESEAMITAALPRSEKVLGAEHPDTLNLLRNLARIALEAERFDDAEARLRDALAKSERAPPADHWFTAQVRGDLGWCLCQQGRAADGAPLLRQSLEGMEAVFGPEHARTAAVRDRLEECTGSRAVDPAPASTADDR